MNEMTNHGGLPERSGGRKADREGQGEQRDGTVVMVTQDCEYTECHYGKVYVMCIERCLPRTHV